MAITQTTILPLKYGSFKIGYHVTDKGDCVSVSYGNLQDAIPVVRIHSSCLFGESLHALDCECAGQLASTLKLIKQNQSGIIVYRYSEGRGIGLENKIKALELQRTQKINTVEAFKLLGFNPDIRTYEVEIAALNDFAINKNIKAATQNPHKLAALQDNGFRLVEEVHPLIRVTKHNVQELLAKKELLGYHITFTSNSEVI